MVSLTKSPSLSVFPCGDIKIRLSVIWPFPSAQILTLPFCRGCWNQRSWFPRPTVLLCIQLGPCINSTPALTHCKVLFFLKDLVQLPPLSFSIRALSVPYMDSCYSTYYIILCNVYSLLTWWELFRGMRHSFFSVITPTPRQHVATHSKYLWTA